MGSFSVYDLHSHVLPGIDDGATDLAVSIAMARQAAASGVKVLACTPHIMPGVYNNSRACPRWPRAHRHS